MAQSTVVSTEKPHSAWKIIRWFVLGALVAVFVLILKKPRPVAEPMPPAVAKEKSEEFQSKMQDLAASHDRGQAAEARFSADEVNAAFEQSATQQTTTQDPSGSEALPEARTVQISFLDDRATGQFVTNFHGKDVYLTVSGKIGIANGYATFDFTEAKIGDMPVPVSLLNPRLQEKLLEPENHEKLKLPDYIAGLRIENGQLVIVEK